MHLSIFHMLTNIGVGIRIRFWWRKLKEIIRLSFAGIKFRKKEFTEKDLIKAEGTNNLHLLLFYQDSRMVADTQIRIMCKDDMESLELQKNLNLGNSMAIFFKPYKEYFMAFALKRIDGDKMVTSIPIGMEGKILLKITRMVYKKNKNGRLH